MKYYAFGTRSSSLPRIQGDKIKDYFSYNEFISNDFTMNAGWDLRLAKSDIEDWTITFVDTGVQSNVGQRLKAVEKYLEGEEMFLANYSDASRPRLPDLVKFFTESVRCAASLHRPSQSFTSSHRKGTPGQDIRYVRTPDPDHGGFFVFRKDIYKYCGGRGAGGSPFNA